MKAAIPAVKGENPVMTTASKALYDLSAAEGVELLSRGEISAEALVRACLDRIASEEPKVGAFAFIDERLALSQAQRIDRMSRGLHWRACQSG